MNELYELARKRRSVRRYGSAHIDDSVIRKIGVCKRILICTRKMCITNDFETGKETESNEKPGLWHDAASGAFRTDGF